MNARPHRRDEVADAVDADVDELADDDLEVVAGMWRLAAIRELELADHHQAAAADPSRDPHATRRGGSARRVARRRATRRPGRPA